MKMDDMAVLANPAHAPAAASPEVFQQLGLITRQLHDTLHQLGVMPKLQDAANNLPDIMMAQDFHDLTGQVVAKVVALAGDLEDSLVKLLVQAAPPEAVKVIEHSTATLNGPVVNPEGRTDVVANQTEVDDLLASLGF
jgi:chemotaxis regulatin CheY-phosphate phosphatase CheZ